ncbi:MAG: hypothetical protein AAFQ96_00740 [Pseudomonadota bacterium]
MNEWMANVELMAWAQVIGAYVAGVASGWLWFGGRDDDAYEDAENQADEAGASIALNETAGEAAAAAKEAGEDMTGAEAAAALFPSRKTAATATKQDEPSAAAMPTPAPLASPSPAAAKAKNGAAQDPAPSSMKFGALESELRKAKQLLADVDEENGEHRARLTELESALKRANGRLKVLMKAVKKARVDN